MATADGTSSLGTRYAPDDPTLPQPWKGLIDGSTGVLYYWNPETNVTQYEKPVSIPPPLPPGPPPGTSMQHLNSMPAAVSSQPDSSITKQSQHVLQISSQQQMQVSPQPTQQPQGSPLGHQVQQGRLAAEHIRPQIMHHSSQQLPSSLSAVPSESGKQGLPQAMQPGIQAPYQQMQPMPHIPHGQMYKGAQVGPPHGFQFTGQQQSQYMLHPQNVPVQGSQTSSQQPPHLTHGQQVAYRQDHKMESAYRGNVEYHQEKQAGFPPGNPHFMQGQQFSHLKEPNAGFGRRDGNESDQGKQAGVSPVQSIQNGPKSGQNMHLGSHLSHGPNVSVQPNQTTHFVAMSSQMQPNNTFIQVQQGTDFSKHHHGSMVQNQTGPGMMHVQHQNLPHVGSKMSYEESHHGRGGNEVFHNANEDVNVMAPHMPKLAPLPMVRNKQDMRAGELIPQNDIPNFPGGVNGPGRPPFHGAYGHPSSVPQYPNNAFARTPLPVTGPDPGHSSTAEAYRQKHEITATGEDVPAPYMTFEATGFPPEILQEMQLAGFTAPTPIQAQTWPIALQNRDIVAIAKTGSGKTLGYLIPVFIHLRRRRNNPQNGPTALVLAPTRELATQIQDEAIKFGRSSRVSCTCLYGGAPKGPQLKELDRGADIVVATPGRLNDILEMKRIDFRQISLLVLDEADRMLDMGFEPQIRKIVNEIPPRRQTLMYTATWPKEVIKIASDLLVNPVQVNIGSVDELAANKSITQYVEMVNEMDKQRRLEQILRSQERGSKIIIFCSTKKLCDHLARSLGRTFGAAAIHGDKSQGERDWVLNQFRSGKCPILVATDVAARGLDIRDIRVVVNYDFPTGIEDYVHRIGRTGRAGATGIAYTFLSEQDWKYAPDLIKVLEGANQVVPPPLRDMASRGGPGYGKDRGAMNRFGSNDVGGRWGTGGGRGGMRDGGFGGGRGGMRDGGFGGRGVGGRGGMRDGNFGGRGGWERGGRGFNNVVDGRGGGRGRGRFDNNRYGSSDRSRSRGRSYSRSPEKVRTWGRSRSRSISRSRSRSRGRSYSRSRSRSFSPRSSSYSRSRSRSRSYERYERRRPPRVSKFDMVDAPPPNNGTPSGDGGSVAADQAPSVKPES